MKMPIFKEDVLAPDSELANAMIPVGSQNVGQASDLAEDIVIEGEFVVEEPSGFSCRGCGTPLLVGTQSCPKCGKTFSIPTPSRSRVPNSTN